MTHLGNNEALTQQAAKARFASFHRDCGRLAAWSYGQRPSVLQGGIGPGGRAPLA
jgi:hypothetical protein